MKKKKLFLIFCLLSFAVVIPAHAATLNQKLKGRILLQVESKGEAWYVNPDDLQPYYMANGEDAYNLMRRFGLGITNNNFDSMKNKFPSKYAGKIFIKVQDSGKAYYINPVDLKPYFLGSANDAYSLMRKLGLGVKNSDFYSLMSQQSTVNNKKLTNQEIVKKLKLSTVYIETSGGSGSGMIIDGFNILTNAHVVLGETNILIYLSNGQSVSAEIKGIDEKLDIALLQVEEQLKNYVILGNSDNTTQGEEVFSLGFPFGIKGDVSFKEGTISRKINDSSGSYLETSAETHPGNSGGPLVDRYGNVVGINSAGLGNSVNGIIVGETIKLAIPINVAKNILADLKNGRNIVNATTEKIDSSKICTEIKNEISSFSSKYTELSKKYKNIDTIIKNTKPTSGSLSGIDYFKGWYNSLLSIHTQVLTDSTVLQDDIVHDLIFVNSDEDSMNKLIKNLASASVGLKSYYDLQVNSLYWAVNNPYWDDYYKNQFGDMLVQNLTVWKSASDSFEYSNTHYLSVINSYGNLLNKYNCK